MVLVQPGPPGVRVREQQLRKLGLHAPNRRLPPGALIEPDAVQPLAEAERAV